MVETAVERRVRSKRKELPRPSLRRASRHSASFDEADSERIAMGIREIDRVLGGGIVPGSLVLLGGEPGIGKSTLVLAVCGAIARATGGTGRVLYASGEESAAQLRMRAGRLGLAGAGAARATIDVLPETRSSASSPRLRRPRRRCWSSTRSRR